MSDARWARLLEHLARARSKPTFDIEERVQRLELAEGLRDVVRGAADGGAWTKQLIAALSGGGGWSRRDLTDLRHNRWIRKLGPAQEELGRALGCFTDADADPVERLASFVRAVEEQQPELATPPEELDSPNPDRDAVLGIGALLNFAFAPEHLPAIRLDLWNLVEQTLGLEWTFRRSLVEQYRLHLDFAHEVERRLREAGVDVRDMLDTQILIQLAAVEADFWAAGTRDSRPGGRPPAYLSICAIYRDEGDYLAEWVEFHRLAGVDRFYLYNNFSKDNHREVLAPYVDEGIVTIRDWPVLDGRLGQMPAYNDCLRWHRHDSRWIGVIDLDEFLFSPSGESLPAVLAEYEQWPGVVARWVMFGPSGHRTKQPGLVIENYQSRLDNLGGGVNVKSVVDPTRVITSHSAHHFGYPYLSAVDENHFPVRGPKMESDSSERLRVNHYHWKSEEEYIAKCARKHAVGRPLEVPTEEHFEWIRAAEEQGRRDDAIQRYVPALKQALGLSERGTARRIS